MEEEKIEMSIQDAINMLRYFEHAPYEPRDKARKFAIQVLKEKKDSNSEWTEFSSEGTTVYKCVKCGFEVSLLDAETDNYCRNCGRKMKKYEVKGEK